MAEAMRALEKGNASEEQQKLALNWIIMAAAGTYDQSFVVGDPHLTTFREGRRSVGLQVVKLLKVKIQPNPNEKTGDE